MKTFHDDRDKHVSELIIFPKNHGLNCRQQF